MLKLRKLSLILSLLLVFSFLVATPANAASLINNYSCMLSDTGSLRVTWSAWTNCITIVEYGTLTVQLQYLDDDIWKTVATYYHSEFNDIVINDGDSTYVSTAGSYRLKTTHYVRLGTETQTKYSTSSTIYIN